MRDLARFYKLFGPQTVFIPVGAKTKQPILSNWQSTTFEASLHPEYQKLLLEAASIGILQGAPSQNLVSIDFDDDQHYTSFLALNPWAEGTLQTRGARGRNVWLRIAGAYPGRAVRLNKPKEPAVGEWRGGSCQTIVDGLHPSGCSYSILAERLICQIPWSSIRWQTVFSEPSLDEPAPPILKVQSVEELPDDCPPIIIPGLLRQGEVILIGGHAKSWKSWALLDLVYCVANGLPWLGFPILRGIVLHIDLELSAWDIKHRLRLIQKSYSAAGLQGDFDYIRLVAHRGLALSLADITRLPGELDWIKLAMVSLDPTYRLLAGEDESDPGIIIELMNKFLALGTELEASIALLQHFGKGNQSDKEAIDRFCGSSVWGRHPDALVTFTQHEDEDCFSVHIVCRSFPPIDEFVVHWEFPRFRLAKDRDPEKLKRLKTGRPKLNTAEQLASIISSNEQISFSDLLRRAQNVAGIKEKTFERRLRESLSHKIIYKSPVSGLYALTPDYLQRNGNHK